MVPKGSLHKITDYYFGHLEFRSEIERSFLEFFGVADLSQLQQDGVNGDALPLLNEWFIYDFKLSNGKSPLEYYLERNYPHFNRGEIQFYSKLIETNFYSLFEVVKVNKGEGLKLTDLPSGKVYEVVEKSATYSLQPGMVFYGRLAENKGHWELVGANPVVMDVRLADSMRRFLSRIKGKITPKDAYIASYGPGQSIDTEIMLKNQAETKPFINPESARKKLGQLLKAHGLDHCANVALIEKWIYKNESVEAFSQILSLLFGLNNCQMSQQALKVFSDALGDFFHSVPQKYLNGLTPEQAYFQNQLKGIPSRVMVTFTPLGGEQWLIATEKAHKYMNKRDYHKASSYFDKVFKLLLMEKTTRADIYRIYANAAICRFGCGEEKEGKILSDIALELNPNYDFGQTVRRRYENGEYKELVKSSQLYNSSFKRKFNGSKKGQLIKEQQFSKFKTDNPAIIYFNWIKSLEINFKTEFLTTSVMTKSTGSAI